MGAVRIPLVLVSVLLEKLREDIYRQHEGR